MFDAPAASLCAQVFARERDFRVRAALFRDRRRKMSVNQVPAKNSAALSEVYNTVFFCPDDLFLIREGAAARRKFMDNALCQLRPRYAAALTAPTSVSMTTLVCCSTTLVNSAVAVSSALLPVSSVP